MEKVVVMRKRKTLWLRRLDADVEEGNSRCVPAIRLRFMCYYSIALTQES